MDKDCITWKPIIGYEGFYEINEDGLIKSLEKRDSKGAKRKERIIKGSVNNHGYVHVRLYKNGCIKTHRIHRIVAETFIENIDKKPYVNHIDGNKANNNVLNLEWVTASENQLHAYRIGLKKQPKGCNHSNSKITTFDLLQIRYMLKNKFTQSEIASKFNIDQTTVSRINTGKCYPT